MKNVTLALVGALLLAGCRSEEASSPEKTFQTFDQALRSGDAAAAAELIDFDTLGRSGNPDWDAFPSSQQTLIAKRMREVTTEGLRAWNWPADGMVADSARITGTNAVVHAAGGGREIALEMARVGEVWRITGGVPGMTSTSGMSAP